MINEKYEISLWEDVWTPGTIQESIPDHFEERKMCVIGSNDITASCRAFDPNLVENVDGTNKFTFKMLINCRDDTYEELIQQFVVRANEGTQPFYTQDVIPYVFSHIEFVHNEYKNPFLSLMTNERKIKVLWKGKWYDLLIKNCQEDSSQGTITYTCTDVFINELSKTGLDIVLDNELENNYGNVTTLAQAVLDGTDWQVDTEKSEIIQQLQEEALFKISTNGSFNAINESNGEQAETLLSGNKVLYIFYNQILNAVNEVIENDIIDNNYQAVLHNKTMQFLYNSSSSEDDDINVTEGDCYRVSVTYTITFDSLSQYNTKWSNVTITILGDNPGDVINLVITKSNRITKRGKRLVKVQTIVYDPLTKKYCNKYKVTSNALTPLCNINDIVYSYRDNEYKDPLSVNNLLVNSSGFLGFDGWTGTGLKFKSWPEFDSNNPTNYCPKGYLKITIPTLNEMQEVVPGITINQGLRYNSSYLSDGVAEGDQFVFRVRAFYGTNDNPVLTYPLDTTTQIVLYPNVYSENNGAYFTFSDWAVENEIVETAVNNVVQTETQFKWLTAIGTCIQPFTRADIYNDNIVFKLSNVAPLAASHIWLEEIQFYPLVNGVDENGHLVRINPGEINTALVTSTFYNYYNHSRNETDHIIYPEDIIYVARENVPYEEGNLFKIIEPVCNANFEKILTVNAKQSNRYNLLKTLAEKFECYIHFEIAHDSATGNLIYDENNKPIKKVYFTREQGKASGIGFVYGIDLKTIQRTIQSDQITTKMIVQSNNNQFGENGFCTIARSKENVSKNSFILDFDYYYSQGLLDKDQTTVVIEDYLENLGAWTTVYNNLAHKITEKNNILLKQQSYLTLYNAAVHNTNQEIEHLWYEIFTLMSDVNDPGTRDGRIQRYEAYINAHSQNDNSQLEYRFYTIMNLEETLSAYAEGVQGFEESINSLKGAISAHTEAQKFVLGVINNFHKDFYNKYATFIQEGTWKDDNYINDDLYYLDALKVAHEASMPKVSYNISVIRVSSLEEFKNKIFNLGDIAYVQDVDFFGYHYVQGIKTPYREKVIISEITSYFEEPEKDSFKVQNYKTEFEDLFQRINYTSQEYAYSSDMYDRIGVISTSNGLINSEVLQDSISAAKVPIHFGSDLVTQDGNGITISDVARANQQTRITSGGIFTTQDGGETWKNAVNAKGVSIEALAPGVLDLGKISVADDTGKVKITKDGIQMKGTTSGEGINYKNGSIEGHFNNLYVETVADPSNPAKVDHLRIDNDEIEHYTCTGNACSYGGKISFGKSSGIALSPTDRSNTLLTLASDTITLDAENGIALNATLNTENGIFTFATKDSENHLISLSIDLNGGKMIYTWWEASGGALPIEHTSVLDLKTFTT